MANKSWVVPSNSPRTVYIHTTMRIPVAPEGWTNMGAIPVLFAEYDSRAPKGNVLDLSLCKTGYEDRVKNASKGLCPVTKTTDQTCVKNPIIAKSSKNHCSVERNRYLWRLSSYKYKLYPVLFHER